MSNIATNKKEKNSEESEYEPMNHELFVLKRKTSNANFAESFLLFNC